MKSLLIDAGNSRLKWSSMDGDDYSVPLPSQDTIAYENKPPIDYLANLIKAEGANHKHVLLVSVQGNEFSEKAKDIASKAGLEFINIISQRQFGEFKNAYKKPEQLGADRFVAMLAAHNIASTDKPKSCIVIDCGTAVTIDAIDENGQHLGGLILPGLQLCSNSLLKNTQQLFIEQSTGQAQQQATFNLLTDNTSDAIISGSFYGLSSAIKETCNKIEKQISSPQSKEVVKIICGGDANVLLPQLSSDFLIHTDLVMQGLKRIAQDTFKDSTKK